MAEMCADPPAFTLVQLNAVRANKSHADFPWPFDSCNIHTILKSKRAYGPAARG